MRNYEFSLTAGAVLSIGGLQADFVRVVTASGPVEITPNEDQPLAGMRQGMSYRAPQSFSRVSFLSETTQTIEVMIGFGNVSDDRVNGQIDTKSQGATLATDSHTLSTSASEILAENEARRSAIIQNIDASITVYVGVSGVTTGNGLKLKPGQSVTLDKAAGAAIYAIAASGTPELRTLTESD